MLLANAFDMVDAPCAGRVPGWPLNSLSIDPCTGKYWLEMTEEDERRSAEMASTGACRKRREADAMASGDGFAHAGNRIKQKEGTRMDERLTRLLEQTRDAHRIMEYDERETADDRLRRKPALRSRLVDDCESLENWKALTPYAKVELSDEHAYEGRHSIRFSAPTNLPDWLPGRGRGRIYAEPGAMRVLPHEDLTEWNRISVRVRPEIPGMRSVCLRVQLYNEGDHPVPDRYMREGAHNVNLKNGEWNHITVEIPYLHRNDAVGIALEYDMCGHEFDAADTAVWYIDKLELQYVEPEMYEGWVPGRGRIAFSGSGYRPDGASWPLRARRFAPSASACWKRKRGRCAYEGEVRRENGLAVMDFTALRTPGRYLLLAGELSTRVFPIDERVWEPSVWKVLNFYLSQRCGWDVPGKHHACHTDLLLKHNGRAIVANGGWHDAADLAQGMNNTSDGTAALFRLARRLKGAQGLTARLYERVLEEARWGLDYVLKTRLRRRLSLVLFVHVHLDGRRDRHGGRHSFRAVGRSVRQFLRRLRRSARRRRG